MNRSDYPGHEVVGTSCAEDDGPPKKPGRKLKSVAEDVASAIREFALAYPWWGYETIAVIKRRLGLRASNRQVYNEPKAVGLLEKRRTTEGLNRIPDLFSVRSYGQ